MKKWLLYFLFILMLFSFIMSGSCEGLPSLSLSENSIRVAVNTTKTVKPVFENFSKSDIAGTWESFDTSVATVTKQGTVKGVSTGTTNITYTLNYDGQVYSASCAVEIYVPATALTTQITTLKINVGETKPIEYKISPKNVTSSNLEWTSADESIATVDGSGNVTAVYGGKTTIQGKTLDGTNKRISVSITVPRFSISNVEYFIDDYNDLVIPIDYYGADSSGVTATETSKAFDCMVSANGDDVELRISARRAGSGTIQLTDKNDQRSKATLNITVTDNAIPDAFALQIKSVTNQQSSYKLRTNINLVNNTSKEIVEVGWLQNYINRFGESIFCYQYDGDFGDNLLVDFDLIDDNVKIKPGMNGSTYYDNTILDSSDNITDVQVAINYYRFSDGTIVNIPDNHLYWFSSKNGYLDKPEIIQSYQRPDDSVFKKSDTFRLGYFTVDVYDFAKNFYMLDTAGTYIIRINEGSPFEKAGFKVRDLIYKIDGISWEDDPNIADIAKAKMVDGKSVIYSVLRNGESIDIEMTK